MTACTAPESKPLYCLHAAFDKNLNNHLSVYFLLGSCFKNRSSRKDPSWEVMDHVATGMKHRCACKVSYSLFSEVYGS